jgi:uncharacterized protein with HEPN domain
LRISGTNWLGFCPFAGIDYPTFEQDLLRIRAPERSLLIISEAAKSLPQELTDAWPEIEWHKVKATGNVLRHEYDRVSPRMLWLTLTESLPRLVPVIAQMLADLPG